MARFIPQIALLPLALAAPLFCQTGSALLASGTPLVVVADRNYAMHAGESISGTLRYPVYAENQLVLPKGTVVTGSVIALHADHSRRVRAALGGDFTPFHTAEVRFTGVVLEDGSLLPIRSDAVSDGAPIYSAVAPPPAKGGLLRREFAAGAAAVRRDIGTFTAPGKGGRLLQFVYARLPYHPETISAGTAWNIEIAESVQVPAQTGAENTTASPERKRHIWDEPARMDNDASGDGSAWVLQANLNEALSSEKSHAGEEIHAVVARPIFGPDHTIAVPQGATLMGTVTRARPARSFGRSGVLSFNFTQLILPHAETQTVETRLTGADAAAQIALDSEGQVTSRPQDKVAIPLVLALMASRPLDTDAGKGNGLHESAGKNATGGSASLSLVGTLVAVAGGSPYVAAGIGYWGAARSFYYRWLARGETIEFPRNTRIVVETMPRRSAPLKPSTQP